MRLLVAVLFLTQAAANSDDVMTNPKSVNPETFMNVSQVICHRMYPSEEYEILTRDGYYVKLNRIPHGREYPRNIGPRPVVFLQHGLLGDSSNWVENLANNSLGFILADSGYDVWLGNSRGTRCSQRHQHLSPDQTEFWDFSFHEMAIYDLPAMINFVLQKTGQKELYYVGYSQGTTIAFIAFSSMPELAQKIKTFFALAPVVTMKHARSPVLKMSFLLNGKPEMLQILLGKTDASLRIRKLWRFLPNLCRHPLLHKPCADLFFLLGGFNEKNFNMTRLDVYTAHYPDSTSVKNLIHWTQVKTSGEFKAFDYGSKNQAAYHQEKPLYYQLEKMPVPTAVWSGGEDCVADQRDVLLLLPRITHLISYMHITDWNHWDFIWGLDSPGRLYSCIVAMVKGSQQGKTQLSSAPRKQRDVIRPQ
ncbi:lipase member M-like [Lagopus leucura]|uniref:lipase member M-like n=1 Tax=Lagopus leucura TaxID=30410 RepID=UPI001C66DE01|nr:lipase member M-like [Lagopus leucura]